MTRADVTGGTQVRSALLVMDLPPATESPLAGGTSSLELYAELASTHLQAHGGVLHRPQVDPGSDRWADVGSGRGRLAATFADAHAAVAAAMALVQAFTTELGSPVSGPGMAIHTGTLAEGIALAQLAHGGQVLVSPSAARLLGRALPPGVNLQGLGTHRLRDLQSNVALYQLRHPALPADFGPPKSLDHLPHNLPTQLTSFVGREAELARLGPALAGSRLLTLTGAGGIGKTRLALQLAAAELDRYADGAWAVELAPLAEPALLPQAVAAALGVAEEAGQPLRETLAAYLQSRQVLLVLDNCEHLVAACAELCQALLQGCPQLRVLATSREALRIPGETTWLVPPLAVPAPELEPEPADEPPGTPLPPETSGPPDTPEQGLERLISTPAVQLFAHRAAAVQPDFRVAAHNAATVAQVCRRLDGVPLAIELAAAWVSLLTEAQILARLEQNLELPAEGSRTADRRHRTLRAAVAWSHELLTAPEQVLWRRLAVFAGEFTLAAAEAVAGADGRPAAGWLETLAALVHKSLVVSVRREGEMGYRLLEPLRQYGLEQLTAAGEADAVRHRHLEWGLELAEAVAPELRRSEQGRWLERLERAHDNLRAALGWALAPAEPGAPGVGPAPAGVRLAAALAPFWEIRGHLHEGRRWLEAARDHAVEPSPLRARVLQGLAVLARPQGDHVQAEALLTAALAIWREHDDRWGMADCLLHLGRVKLSRCEFHRARVILNQSLAAWRAVGDPWGVAWALAHLGTACYHTADYDQAAALFNESLVHMREVGDQQGVVRILHGLGLVAMEQGHYAGARATLAEGTAVARELGMRLALPGVTLAWVETVLAAGESVQAATLLAEALAVARTMGGKAWLAQGHLLQGSLALHMGNVAMAVTSLAEGLAWARKIGDRFAIARCLEALGRAARAQGHTERALALTAQAIGLLWQIGDRTYLAAALVSAGGLMAATGEPVAAARTLAAAAALRATIGTVIYPMDRPGYERDLDTLRARLGDDGFAAAWVEGEAGGLAAAVTAVLAQAGLPLPDSELPDGETLARLNDADGRRSGAARSGAAPGLPPGGSGAGGNAAAHPTVRPAGLTPRELEIARLVAQGLTDRAVAARLHISPRTVDTHLRNIFGKVEVTSRTGLAAWVLRQGLVHQE